MDIVNKADTAEFTVDHDSLSGVPKGLRPKILPLSRIFNAVNINFKPDRLLAILFGSVVIFDPNGQEKSNQPISPADTVRVYVGPKNNQKHIWVDHVPTKGNTPAHMSVGGFKYSYNPAENGSVEDPKNTPRTQMAFKERVLAAVALVKMAKARGWKSVSFGSTSHESDRYILSLACEAYGLEHSEQVSKPEHAEGIEKFFNVIKSSPKQNIMIEGDENFQANMEISSTPSPAPKNEEPMIAESFLAKKAAMQAMLQQVSAAPS